MAGRLVLVGTPLGHRGDLSPRARAAMEGADLLLCEDTRSVARLLPDAAGLPPRVSCHRDNERARVPLLLEHLAAGHQVAYVSEAGMPLWSDPGAELVRAAAEAGFEVDVVPGPCAAVTAVCHAGVRGAVRFVGFAPRSGRARRELLERLGAEADATVLYEAGNRSHTLLADLARALPDAAERAVTVCRELTKVHQEILRGTVAQLSGEVREPLRGEVTLVLAGTRRTDAVSSRVEGERAAARATLDALLDPGLRPRARARALAELTGLSAREIYDRLVAPAPGDEG